MSCGGSFTDGVVLLLQIAALDPVESERPAPLEEPSQHTDQAEVCSAPPAQTSIQ